MFLTVISFGLPAGLVLYFAVSNLYRVGQQWFISRSIYGIKRGDLPLPAPDPAPAAPSQGFFASLKEHAPPPASGDTPMLVDRQEGGRLAKRRKERQGRVSPRRASAKPATKPSSKMPQRLDGTSRAQTGQADVQEGDELDGQVEQRVELERSHVSGG